MNDCFTQMYYHLSIIGSITIPWYQQMAINNTILSDRCSLFSTTPGYRLLLTDHAQAKLETGAWFYFCINRVLMCRFDRLTYTATLERVFTQATHCSKNITTTLRQVKSSHLSCSNTDPMYCLLYSTTMIIIQSDLFARKLSLRGFWPLGIPLLLPLGLVDGTSLFSQFLILKQNLMKI